MPVGLEDDVGSVFAIGAVGAARLIGLVVLGVGRVSAGDRLGDRNSDWGTTLWTLDGLAEKLFRHGCFCFAPRAFDLQFLQACSYADFGSVISIVIRAAVRNKTRSWLDLVGSEFIRCSVRLDDSRQFPPLRFRCSDATVAIAKTAHLIDLSWFVGGDLRHTFPIETVSPIATAADRWRGGFRRGGRYSKGVDP